MKPRITKFWGGIVTVLTVLGILITVNQLFYLGIFGIKPINSAYLYFLIAMFMPIAFIIQPFSKKMENKSVRWYDVLLVVLSFSIPLYMGINAQRIISEGWEYISPALATVFSVIFWVIILEALRRVAGLPIMIISAAFSLYPLISGSIPISFLSGQSFDFLTTARNHVMSTNSVIGIPFDTVGSLLIGFMLFGVVLTASGGGDFFFNLAQSLFGRYRGGPAKVAVISSAFFGMLSGSAISNTITTGAMTIPSMKKAGYPPHYAGAIEATASTGGTITPPIMGSAAFIMASFIGVPYVEIAMAAAIPAFLYFFALLIQADGYAAKNNLKGIPKANLPAFSSVLKQGWPFLTALVLLTYLLVVMRNEGQAPFYVCILLFALAMIKKETRFNMKKLYNLALDAGKILSELTCLIAGIGFIVGALSITGVSFSFARELVSVAGDNMFFILVAGAITSFVLGMGMTVSAVYIFLAVVMAPALVQFGIDPIAAHLFVLYWATVSYITPPVALASFAAAGIADANPMKTGFTSVRLGIVTFLVPFIIVYNPALIGRAPLPEVIMVVGTAIIGIFLLSSALEGYVLWAGDIRSKVLRLVLGLTSLLIIAPFLLSSLIGIGISIILLLVIRMNNKSALHSKEITT
ncbi:TRAP transporter permease [Psychrobacillus lasiicapitis]|uniref:TRAP transporter fused permease subunit n=1 Tax=Psychrobacillus lasiicapitis TaxID=1636719 RepID=A0A544T312_9BACI|nr:TRAP transporter fused permease subunit [Psychrobacillus lasiicapitis]TQR11833.1 TRAP transporter fused permease subunit [Psychrobacillus lasiicapitis]GGA19839.1 C4-dicarboxylate ABC transporter [Psychrobacillus lasiicapitis]